MSKIILPELLDSYFAINGEMIDDNGEDCYYFSFNEEAGILSVFDGCGGLGAMKYASFNNKTGAFIASRTAAYATQKWFDFSCEKQQLSSNYITVNLKKFIDKELSNCSNKTTSAIKIKGSMVRPFPTTMATALLKQLDNTIEISSIWSGDSRVYILDDKGLAQLSVDDIEGEDALSNITGDGVLTNVISADGNYNIHLTSCRCSLPFIIFTATDGCFGYIQTPMHFEYIFLFTLIKSKNMVEWQSNLENIFKEFSGDDHTMCLAAIGFGDFKSLKKYFKNRYNYILKKYIEPLENPTDELITAFWNEYKIDYYRYLQ